MDQSPSQLLGLDRWGRNGRYNRVTSSCLNQRQFRITTDKTGGTLGLLQHVCRQCAG